LARNRSTRSAFVRLASGSRDSNSSMLIGIPYRQFGTTKYKCTSVSSYLLWFPRVSIARRRPRPDQCHGSGHGRRHVRSMSLSHRAPADSRRESSNYRNNCQTAVSRQTDGLTYEARRSSHPPKHPVSGCVSWCHRPYLTTKHLYGWPSLLTVPPPMVTVASTPGRSPRGCSAGRDRSALKGAGTAPEANQTKYDRNTR
jgi:hypothetical protein